ncbi:MAG: glycosyltransferase family 9 protein [Deltaproteobacteria bacterium]|nr:glycosyltransferase family 9 protein [Deltaproteobacteria bacterium]
MRILVVRLTALGDVVLASVLPEALRRRFEGARVELVTEARFAPLMVEAAAFDRVIPYDRNGSHAGWAGVREVARAIGAERFDAVVDLQGKLRTRALLRHVKATTKLVLAKRSPLEGMLALFGHDPPLVHAHTLDLYLSAVSTLGVAADETARARLRRAPRTHGMKLGLSVGATHATKLWPHERFLELARELRRRFPNAELVPIGGPKDKSIVDVLAAEANGRADVPSLDVVALWRVVSDLDALVGVDSGPTHLAAAVGVPVVALFGPTSPRRWGPRGPADRIVSRSLPCSPCSNTGGETCPIGTHACMREIQVAQVVAALEQALEPR